MDLQSLGIIGNGQFTALVRHDGVVVWCCLPRFDAEPVFGALLDPDGGDFRIGAAGGGAGHMTYVENTNVLETVFTTSEGRFRVLDFAPRFEMNGRAFHPTQLVRIIEPIEGTPRIEVHCDPRLGWSRRKPETLAGSNHLRFEGFANPLRLTTDVPLSHLDGRPFALTERKHAFLAWGAPVEETLGPLADRFLAETVRHWRRWVKGCAVPPLFQKEVIRSALTLRLHCFDDTGAIIAAPTTSIPEAAGSGRTWDYRYCWLRDSYYVLNAFARLGRFEERESFVKFLLNVAASARDLEFAPLYRVDGRNDLDEQVVEGWQGFAGHGPVRVGNAAARHRQNDVYGEMVLALAPVFLDERFADERSPATLDLIARLARKAIAAVGTPDAGIWEVRKDWKPTTFSSLMSWAGADRMAAVAARHQPDSADAFKDAADGIRECILRECWNADLESFVSEHHGRSMDASLLQALPLRFLPASDARLVATVRAIERRLGRDGWLLRYDTDDGLGVPTTAFTLCTFWLAEALAALGRRDAAHKVTSHALSAANPLGLLAEDWDPVGQRAWGNFPQAYSHVGLIHAAFASSPPWGAVL